jgi:hypothetical protein
MGSPLSFLFQLGLNVMAFYEEKNENSQEKWF